MFSKFNPEKYGVTDAEMKTTVVFWESLREFKNKPGDMIHIDQCNSELQSFCTSLIPIMLKIVQVVMYPKIKMEREPLIDVLGDHLTEGASILRNIIKRGHNKINIDYYSKMMKIVNNVCSISTPYIQTNFYEKYIEICQKGFSAETSRAICSKLKRITPLKNMIDQKGARATISDYETYFSEWQPFFNEILIITLKNYIVLLKSGISSCFKQWLTQEIELNAPLYLKMMTLKGGVETELTFI